MSRVSIGLEAKSRFFRASAALVLTAIVFLSGCGLGGGTNGSAGETANARVTVTDTAFSPSEVDIHVHQSVAFANGSSSPLTICGGEDGTCVTGTNGPAALTYPPGLTIAPGKSIVIVYDTSTGLDYLYYTLLDHDQANLKVAVQ